VTCSASAASGIHDVSHVDAVALRPAAAAMRASCASLDAILLRLSVDEPGARSRSRIRRTQPASEVHDRLVAPGLPGRAPRSARIPGRVWVPGRALPPARRGSVGAAVPASRPRPVAWSVDDRRGDRRPHRVRSPEAVRLLFWAAPIIPSPRSPGSGARWAPGRALDAACLPPPGGAVFPAQFGTTTTVLAAGAGHTDHAMSGAL
jgi:hypothetical protein